MDQFLLKFARFRIYFGLLLLLSFFSACKTEVVNKTYDGNQALLPGTVPTVKVENYVNRLYIDLLGRVPTQNEMNLEVARLKDGKLSKDVRLNLITRLQSSDTFVEGDSSYKKAYYQRIYDMVKSSLCEGAADGEFTRHVGLAQFSLTIARLEGDSVRVFQALEQMARNGRIVTSKDEYRFGSITLNEMYARMLDNNVYDNINMNTFNFVNASFDDLFYRFPTKIEFETAYSIIETNKLGALMGSYASNKREYCLLLCHSDEFYEGIIKWVFQNLLGREPRTEETAVLFKEFKSTGDLPALQQKILVTDEYANF
jgi:hypothetical protein